MFREDREAVGNSWSVRSASIVEQRLAVRPFTIRGICRRIGIA
jgi:hypothetical protein